MAVGVVDVLEAVEVEEEHGERAFVAPGAVQLALQSLHQRAAIGDARQRVRLRGEGDGGVPLRVLQGDGGVARQFGDGRGIVRGVARAGRAADHDRADHLPLHAERRDDQRAEPRERRGRRSVVMRGEVADQKGFARLGHRPGQAVCGRIDPLEEVGIDGEWAAPVSQAECAVRRHRQERGPLIGDELGDLVEHRLHHRAGIERGGERDTDVEQSLGAVGAPRDGGVSLRLLDRLADALRNEREQFEVEPVERCRALHVHDAENGAIDDDRHRHLALDGCREGEEVGVLVHIRHERGLPVAEGAPDHAAVDPHPLDHRAEPGVRTGDEVVAVAFVEGHGALPERDGERVDEGAYRFVHINDEDTHRRDTLCFIHGDSIE